MQSLWMVVAALFYAFYAVFVKYSGFEGIGSWEILFQINFRRCPLLRRYAFQWNYAFHNSSLAAFDPLDVRHSFNHLRHLFRLSSEYRTGDDIELHVAVVCRGLHSDDFPAPSRSSELGADGDGAFRFYRSRDHARTNHRTA